MPETPVACPDCDLLQHVPLLPPRGKALCRRCGKVLATDKPGANERTLALAVGAAIVFANALPLMGLSAARREVDTTIIGGAWMMWQEGQQLTAALVALCAVVAPAVYIGIIVVLLAVRIYSPAPLWVGELLHWGELAREWAMTEVMMLGVLVALVKIADLATVVIGVGIFATGVLIALITMVAVNFDSGKIWTQVQWTTVDAQSLPNPTPAIDYQGVKK